MDKLSRGDRVFLAAGAVYLISTFLPWFSFPLPGFGTLDLSAWNIGFLWGRVPFVLVLAAGVAILARVFSTVSLPARAHAGIVYLGVGALALVLAALKALVGESILNRGSGLFIAAAAAAGLAFGGFLKFTESGGTINDLKSTDGIKRQLG